MMARSDGEQTGQQEVFTGTWAQYVVAPASACVVIPDVLPDNQAALALRLPTLAFALLEKLKGTLRRLPRGTRARH